MVATKTATLNLRIDPFLKEALRVAAIQEHRSIANLPLVAIFMATYIGGAILIAKKMAKNVGVFVFWGWLLMANIPCMYFAKYVSQTLGFWPS